MPKPLQLQGPNLRYLPYSFRRQGLHSEFDEATYAGGISRDSPHSAIQAGYAFDIIDYLTSSPGRLYKRGGSTYASDPLGGDIVVAVANMPFHDDPARTIAISSTGAGQNAYDITGMGSSLIGAIDRQPAENPPFGYDSNGQGMLCITEGYDTPSVPPAKIFKAIGGGPLGIDAGGIGGGAPPARYSCFHLGRLVLANSSEHPNRVWFSKDGAPEDWTVESWTDSSNAVTGLASISGVLIIFHRDGAERILGQIPPGFGTAQVPFDMQLQPMDAAGCMDARSIVRGVGVIYFAHESGIYYTNGSGAQSLTTKSDGSGISALWRQFSRDLDMSLGNVCCMGLYSEDWLLCSMRHDEPDFQLVCYLPTGAWMHTSTNIAAVMYASLEAPNDAIYAANALLPSHQVLNLTTLFNPTPGPPVDHDGAPVLPLLETRMVGDGAQLKAFSDAHITYDMRTVSGTPPALHVYVSKGIEANNFQEVAESPLHATTDAERHRFTVSKDSQAVQYRFQQANQSERTEIYMVESLWRSFYMADGQ